MARRQSEMILRNELKELNQSPVFGFSVGLDDDNNIYKWSVVVVGPPNTLYEGGTFSAVLEFPKNYPILPPTLKFTSKIWHPNISVDGSVCISILHQPGEDQFGYEKAEERWSPVLKVETILLSVISMLSSPNIESPANVDAAKQLREDPDAFKTQVIQCVRKSQETE